MLACVGYGSFKVEHYGLERRRQPGGRWEKVDPTHSWNSDFVLSNLVLFQLQRHSDHHAHALRRYQLLRHFDQSPQLPGGYGAMVLLALVPWAWRRVMDPRVARVRAARPALFSPVLDAARAMPAPDRRETG